MKQIQILTTFLLITTFQTPLLAQQDNFIEEPVDLTIQNWIHGAENCEDTIDPPIQVVQYTSTTWILRQNKCANYEAPFMYLFIGEDKALLMDTGATKDDDLFPLYKTVHQIISDWSKKKRSS
ncbi:hypothetical protein [Maribacter arcticus]|uniref:hypothetical protein n=1 Tax=Maribacter arcticus TaxID=561365 RepID=UPI0030013ACC